MSMARDGLEQGPKAANSLKELLEERYTEEPFERSFYQRDLAAVPALLARLLAQTSPDGIARPQTTEEVAQVVAYAASQRIPVTPRAAATSVYWSAVPVHAGLVLDLTGLKGLVSLDENQQTVTVWAGTRWLDLEALLNARGYALCTYPSSAPASTVGGWVNMEGFGIGSLKYGGLKNLVVSLQVVLPDGQVSQVTRESNPSLAWFLGSEGTLSIITQVELSIRKKPELLQNHLLSFQGIQALQEALLELSSASPTPYDLHFADAALNQMIAEAGFHQDASQNTVLATHDGAQDELAAGQTTNQRILEQTGGALLSKGCADEEWADRFNMLKVKRAGPTVLGAEILLPIQNLAAYLVGVQKLSQQQKLIMGSYGHVVEPGHLTVMSLFPSNESKLISYVLDLSLTWKLFHIAFRYGGRPYGVGFWNSPYLKYRWSRPELVERIAVKKQLDPANILNPGKYYAPPWILSPGLFNLAMNTLSTLRRFSS